MLETHLTFKREETVLQADYYHRFQNRDSQQLFPRFRDRGIGRYAHGKAVRRQHECLVQLLFWSCQGE